MLRSRHHKVEHRPLFRSYELEAYQSLYSVLTSQSGETTMKRPDIHHRTQKGHTLGGRLRQFYKTYINKT